GEVPFFPHVGTPGLFVKEKPPPPLFPIRGGPRALGFGPPPGGGLDDRARRGHRAAERGCRLARRRQNAQLQQTHADEKRRPANIIQHGWLLSLVRRCFLYT